MVLRATDSMNNVGTVHVDRPRHGRHPADSAGRWASVRTARAGGSLVSARFLPAGSWRSMAGTCWRGRSRGRPGAPSPAVGRSGRLIRRGPGTPHRATLRSPRPDSDDRRPPDFKASRLDKRPSADHQRVEREHGVLLRRFVGALEPLSRRRGIRHFVPHNNHGVALERHPHDVHDSSQRVRPLAGGEPHHAQA